MVDPVSESQSGTIETRKDLGTGTDATYAYWMGQEKIAEREERKWVKQARRIVQRYRDERPEANKDTNRFNILWSNVQTLIPTLYARTPKADVERRFRDDDPTARLAAILLERAIEFSADHFEFDDLMAAVTEDRLLPGRGTARVLYVPHYGDEIKAIEKPKGDDETGENAEFENADAAASTVSSKGDEDEAEPLREVTYEEAKPSYVFWEDYREGPARKWAEVPWLRYRSYLTREELVKRFGKKKGAAVNLDFEPKGSSSGDKDKPPPDMFKKAVVHEYWDKTKRQAVWLAPGTPDLVLDSKDDPLKLPGFFPSPNPCLATTTNDKRIPVPDYIEYQDQARELDNLTARIDILTKALKIVGFYPGANKQVLQQVFDDNMENRLIPVEDWQFFSDKGPSGGITWVPIQQVAETLIQLYNARDRVKALLYEITGIGDIMRGMTSPDETLGAQELKANFSTRRITPQQKHVARFARDMFRLLGGVIAEHFSAKTISEITGYPQLKPVPQLPPQPVMPQQPLQLAPPQAQPMPGANPGMPTAPGVAPPPAPPSPQMQAYQQQMAQWQQLAQKVQALTQDNAQKQQEFDAAVALIKEDGVHGFRIDIEADSTIAPDEQAEKVSRTQFMEQFVPFMEQMVPIAQGNPAMAELAKEFALFVVRGWRVARPLEETIGKAFDAVAQMPPNPKATGQDGKAPAGKQGADPAEIAAKVHETQTDAQVQTQKSSDAVQIAHDKNVTALVIQNKKSNDAREQAAAEAPLKVAELNLEAGRLASQHEIATIREQNVAAKSAGGLT
jgi:hypothetical protein